MMSAQAIAVLWFLTVGCLFVAVAAALTAMLRAARALDHVARLQQAVEELERRLEGGERRAESPVPPTGTSAGAEAPAPPPSAPAPPSSAAGPLSAAAPLGPTSAAPPTTSAVPAPAYLESLEQRIGGRWLLYAGLSAIVVAMAWFIKYAFDNEWVTPRMRVSLGVVAGVALVGLGERFARRGLARYGEGLVGAGLGVLYLAVYAAFAFYGLIGRWPAFVLLVAVTAFTYFQASRHRSPLLALVAVVAGFATPWLIGDPHVALALFAYHAVLVAGTLLMAARHDWPLLNVASYVLCVWSLASWADRHYTPRLWAGVELFLTLLLLLFLWAWRGARASAHPRASLAAALLASTPFVYHGASLGVLAPHPGPRLVYLIAFTLAGLVAARQLGSLKVRALVWAGAALPALAWAGVATSADWFTATLTTVVAMYALHVVAAWDALTDTRAAAQMAGGGASSSAWPRALAGGEIALLHANGWWVLAATAMVMGLRHLTWRAPLALAFAVVNAGLASVMRHRAREAALHHLVLALGLTAVAAALQFDGVVVTIAWAAEGAGLVWLGFRSRRRWVRVAGELLLALAVARVLDSLTDPLPVSSLALANARTLGAAFVVAMLYLSAWWHARFPSAGSGQAFSTGSGQAALILAANVLTVATLSAEVGAWYDWRAHDFGIRDVSGQGPAGDLARHATLSVLWALYAVGLVAVGIWRRYAPIRYLAIALFAFTIAKVLVVDLATLDRLSRMLSMLALGVLMLVASYLYQRLRMVSDQRA